MAGRERGHHRAGGLLAGAWLTVVATGGCSWIAVTRPPPRPVDPAPPVLCTQSVAAPVVDTIVGVAAVGAGATVTWLSTTCLMPGSCPTSTGGVVAGAALIALGVVEGVSAGFGYAWTAECRELSGLQAKCISGVEASCAGLRGPPTDPRGRGDVSQPCRSDAECRAGLSCRYSTCLP